MSGVQKLFQGAQKMFQKFANKEVLYQDIGEGAVLTPQNYRAPSPGSQKKMDFPLNFPKKAEKLAKNYYYQRKPEFKKISKEDEYAFLNVEKNQAKASYATPLVRPVFTHKAGTFGENEYV